MVQNTGEPRYHLSDVMRVDFEISNDEIRYAVDFRGAVEIVEGDRSGGLENKPK